MHIETTRLHLSPINDGRFRIFDRHSRRRLGEIALRASRHSNARGLELSYTVTASQRRRGFCAEAATALVDHAFERALTQRVYASTAWSNEASRRVLVGLGMQQLDIAMVDWESLADELGTDDAADDLTPYARVEYEIHRHDWAVRRGQQPCARPA